MKNKSILYRFGLVVLVVLLLVLILPSSKIDLSSSLSACSQMTVRTEKITSFASGDDLQYHLLSMDDAEYGQLRELLSQVTFRKKFNQTYSSYSHDYPAQSVTLSGYDDAENHQLLLTVYSDGVCILNNAFVSVKYPGGGAAELYQVVKLHVPFLFSLHAMRYQSHRMPRRRPQSKPCCSFLLKKRMEWRNWRLRSNESPSEAFKPQGGLAQARWSGLATTNLTSDIA